MLLATYPPGAQNSLADSVSGHFPTYHRCEIHNSLLNKVFTQWRTSSWDLFTSRMNKKFNLDCSRAALGQVSGGNNALSWTDHLRYTFPPHRFCKRFVTRKLKPCSSHPTGSDISVCCLQMSSCSPISFDPFLDLLTQENTRSDISAWTLFTSMVWYLDGQQT